MKTQKWQKCRIMFSKKGSSKTAKSIFGVPSLIKNRLNEIAKKVNFTKVLMEFFENNEILNFSFVRHPFTRLVSSYTDKILHAAPASTKSTFKVFQVSKM